MRAPPWMLQPVGFFIRPFFPYVSGTSIDIMKKKMGGESFLGHISERALRNGCSRDIPQKRSNEKADRLQHPWGCAHSGVQIVRGFFTFGFRVTWGPKKCVGHRFSSKFQDAEHFLTKKVGPRGKTRMDVGGILRGCGMPRGAAGHRGAPRGAAGRRGAPRGAAGCRGSPGSRQKMTRDSAAPRGIFCFLEQKRHKPEMDQKRAKIGPKSEKKNQNPIFVFA